MEKNLRLRSNRDYRKVYRRGKNQWNRHFTVIARKTGRRQVRVGFSITKKYGKAVTRNRMKRRLREIVRLNASSFQEGYDYVVIPKKHTVSLSYRDLEGALLQVFKRFSQ